MRIGVNQELTVQNKILIFVVTSCLFIGSTGNSIEEIDKFKILENIYRYLEEGSLGDKILDKYEKQEIEAKIIFMDPEELEKLDAGRLTELAKRGTQSENICALFLLARRGNDEALRTLQQKLDESGDNFLKLSAHRLQLVKLPLADQIFLEKPESIEVFFETIREKFEEPPTTSLEEISTNKDIVNRYVVYGDSNKEITDNELLALLEDKNKIVQMNATLALALRGNELAVSKVAGSLLYSQNGFCRWHAIEVLKKLVEPNKGSLKNDQKLIKRLIEIANNPFQYKISGGSAVFVEDAYTLLTMLGYKLERKDDKWVIKN